MRLKCLHQIHVSAVKADTIRPGEEFTISDSAGADLLKRHPEKFEQLEEVQAVEGDEEQMADDQKQDEGAKQEQTPENKMKGKSKNKSE